MCGIGDKTNVRNLDRNFVYMVQASSGQSLEIARTEIAQGNRFMNLVHVRNLYYLFVLYITYMSLRHGGRQVGRVPSTAIC